MMQLVDNLRLTADPNQVHLETADVNALIEATLNLQAHQLQAEGIDVTVSLEPTLPSTGADPYKLQQVLVNVINNARQAMATIERGRTDDVRRKLTITTRAIPGNSETPPNIQVRIADTGPGIPPEVMAHIFEPFYTTKSGNDMGLGLSICEQIMKNHGGRIWAENNQIGVTFVLELPAEVPKPRDPASNPDRLPARPVAATVSQASPKRQPALV
jgi:signal transduction histidine kinase